MSNNKDYIQGLARVLGIQNKDLISAEYATIDLNYDPNISLKPKLYFDKDGLDINLDPAPEIEYTIIGSYNPTAGDRVLVLRTIMGKVFVIGTISNTTLIDHNHDSDYVNVDGDTMTGDLTLDGAAIQFDTDYTPSIKTEGLTYFGGEHPTLNTVLGGAGNNQVTLQHGLEIFAYVRNSTGSNWNNGQVIAMDGASGNHDLGLLAKADADATSLVYGIATQDIANNESGFVTRIGSVHDLNTNSWNEGDLLYLSATTAGALTSTPPSYPNYRLLIGKVIRKHLTQGVIALSPTFINWADGVTLNNLYIKTGATIEGGLIVNETGGNFDTRIEGENDQNLLFTDASTDRVGIGINAPEAKLHIKSTEASTSFIFEKEPSVVSASMFETGTQIIDSASSVGDGFGLYQMFKQKINGTEYPLGRVGSYRDGADNQGVSVLSSRNGSNWINNIRAFWSGITRIGGATDYTEFEADGTLKFVNGATVFKDELGDILKLKSSNPTRISDNVTECGVDFNTTATYTDYLYTNVQLNHHWKNGSNVYPHIHWFQNQNATPNWLLQYRWQKQGSAKTTAWTDLICNSNAFTYTSGTLNQISYSAGITPPVGYGQVSDIIQFRLIRDTANTSTLFSGPNLYSGAATALSFDCHIEVDTIGSRTEYTK